jgi:hypothetical protein
MSKIFKVLECLLQHVHQERLDLWKNVRYFDHGNGHSCIKYAVKFLAIKQTAVLEHSPHFFCIYLWFI